MLRGMLTRGRLLAGIGGLALAGLIAAGTAFAETPTPTATPTNPVATQFQTFIHSLAQKLGKSDADVQTAITQTQQEMIDQAAKDGKLPQAAADRLRNRLQSGPLPFSPVPHAWVRARAGVAILGHELQAAATFLGLTPADLKTQLQSGKSLADVAQAQGKSRDDLKTALINDAQAQLKQQVDNGRITQAQADQLLTKFKNNVDKLIDAKGNLKGGAFGQRGVRPFWGHGQPKPQATPAPTATPGA